MTDQEWDQVMGVFGGLWPNVARKLTDEESATWQRVCAPHHHGTVIRELRAMAETLKGYPRPAQLRDRLMALQQGEAKVHESPAIEEQDRRLLRDELPNMATAIESMSAGELRLCRLNWEWSMSCFMYGPHVPSTIAAYWKWQRAIDADAPFGAWSAESEAEYRTRLPGLAQRKPDEAKPSLLRVVRDFLTTGAIA